MKTVNIQYYSQSAAGIVAEKIQVNELRNFPEAAVTVSEYIPSAMGIKETEIPVSRLLQTCSHLV